MTAAAPRRSIIIVNWNAGPGLAACLGSVASEAASGQEVILVDNASTDGSLATAIAGRPWVQVVRQPDNLGFAGGANAGAAVARGAVLIFLNPDAVAAPGAVAQLADALGAGQGAAVAGGGLADLAEQWQPGAARFAPLAHLLLDTRLGRWRARHRTMPYTVDWVYGTFMAVDAERFRRLGGFDPRYFCYGEDLDLCFRMRQAGGQVWHVPGARVRHGKNVSAVQRFGLGRDAEAVRGELNFYAYRLGRWAVARYRVGGVVKYSAKWCWQMLRGHREAARGTLAILAVCREFRMPP